MGYVCVHMGFSKSEHQLERNPVSLTASFSAARGQRL